MLCLTMNQRDQIGLFLGSTFFAKITTVYYAMIVYRDRPFNLQETLLNYLETVWHFALF